jgi:RNA polymerase sigma-70 factor (ECF subfamily)
MDEDADLADRFEAHRARLRAVAYHALGSPSEADDAVQEAWLRLSQSGSSNIENLGGWLTTVVARVCRTYSGRAAPRSTSSTTLTASLKPT